MASWNIPDLKSVDFGGTIKEDVMDRIWVITDYPLPFSDEVGEAERASSEYKAWVTDALATPNPDGAVVDGVDIQNGGDESSGERVGNYIQANKKDIKLSFGSEAVDSIGNIGKMAYQVMQRQKEVRRDQEASCLSTNASVAPVGDATAGQAAGLGAAIKTNTTFGVGGADGGFSNGIVAAPTNGTVKSYTEADVRAMLTSVYDAGGDPSILMSTTGVIGSLSQILFDSGARIAVLQTDTPSNSGGDVTARGAVNVFVSDHDVTVRLIGNRHQQAYNADTAAAMYAIDTSQAGISYLSKPQSTEIGRRGLSTERTVYSYWTLWYGDETAHGAIRDIDVSAPFVANP